MKEFTPRPFQKEVMDKIVNSRMPLPRYFFPRGKYNAGIDYAAPGSKDKTVMTVMKRKNGHDTIIFMDEMSNWPTYKWYRNPVKWLRWRRMMKVVEQHTGYFELQTSPKGKNTFYKGAK